jgi:YbgC/YbaW family acyl-CoA thioester hydrolase
MTAKKDEVISITVHLPVRLDEISYLGFVHSSNYQKYLEHARVKLLEQQNLDLLAWVKKGYRAVVVNDTINYHHSARYGDVLAITCLVEEISNSSIRLGYTIRLQGTEREILQATTTLVCIDPDGKPTPFPLEVREALSQPM